MGCLVVLLAVFSPRLALLLVWLLTPLVQRAFDGILLPLLGFIFLPITTLVYVILWTPGVGVSGLRWIWVGLGLLLDLSAHGASSTYRR